MPVSIKLPARIDAFDEAVDDFFERRLRGRPMLDRIFYSASALGDHSLIWLILGVLRGLRSVEPDDKGHHLRAAARVGVGMGVESAVVNLGIKSLFRRTRPVHSGIRPLHLRTPRTSSFPSGHATSAFTAAALLGDQDQLKPLYYGVALIVAWSRVYVKIHHASDVVAGIAIGAVLGRIGRKIWPLPAAQQESGRRRGS